MNSPQYAENRSDHVVTLAPPYSVLLRANTRAAHLACEHAMDLDRALAGHGAYRAVLRKMRAAYSVLAADNHIREAEALLGRRGAIAADLTRLAQDLGDELAHAGVTRPQPLETAAEAIGAQYVLAGSRLGGRVIAKRIIERLPGAHVSFFRGDDGDHAQTWRAFQGRLDDLGRSGRCDYLLVRRGAEWTFNLIAQALSGRLQCH